MSTDDRWQQRLQNLNRSYECFERACSIAAPDEVYRAGILQFFQMSFELAWKTLKDKLAYDGIDAASPREVIKKSFAAGLIEAPDTWLLALQTRNLFTHVYDESSAEQALQQVKEVFHPMLKQCVQHLNALTHE